MTSKFGTSQIELDSTKIIFEDDKEIVIPAILAREGVLPYADGKAFRPKEELEKSAFTFDGAWCVSKRHPAEKILTKPYEITGKVSDPQYDAERKLVKGKVHLYKGKNDSTFIQDVRDERLKDVSIGFLYEDVWTPGEYQGQKYDYVQRNLLINHVAVGVPRGRMGSPLIGLGLDAVLEDLLGNVCIAADPWEENDNTIRSGHGPAAAAETCRTKVLSEAQGISLVVCKNKDSGDWYDQSFLFAKAKGWTMEKAKAWFASHKGNDASDWYIKAEVDELVRTIGADTFGKNTISRKVEDLMKKSGNDSPLNGKDVKEKVASLALLRKELTDKLWPPSPPSPLSERERNKVSAELTVLDTEIKALEVYLATVVGNDSAPSSSGSAQVAGPQQAVPLATDKSKKETLSTPDLIAKNKRIRELAGTIL